MAATTVVVRRSARERERGFTLLEIMIVITIISVLAAFAIPKLLEAQRAAQKTKALAALRQIYDAQQRYREKNGVYAPNLATLVAAGILKEPFNRTNLGPQPIGYFDFQTRVPSGASAVPPITSAAANAAVRFRVGCAPVGTTTVEKLKRGDQMLFMLENGHIFEHKPPICGLLHLESTLQSESDTQFGGYYTPLVSQ